MIFKSISFKFTDSNGQMRKRLAGINSLHFSQTPLTYSTRITTKNITNTNLKFGTECVVLW